MFDGGAVLAPPDLEHGDDRRSRGALSGSTAVSCWLSSFAYGSTESRRETISQFEATRSAASALTMSMPAPQSTRSTPPNAACTRSAPRAGEHPVGGRRADDQLAALRAVDRRGGRSRGQREEQEDGEESAHGGRPEYPRRGARYAAVRPTGRSDSTFEQPLQTSRASS